MLVLQFVLGFLLLNTSAGNVLISTIANGFTALLNCAREGINFVLVDWLILMILSSL